MFEYVVGGAAVIISTLVIFAYLIFIWWLDRYEREPFWMVLLTFAYGGMFGTMFGCFLSIFPSLAATAVFGAVGGGFVSAVIVAPVAEEFTKGLVFGVLVLTKHFDNETDGLIYGAATGLGFAAVENLVYFVTADSFESLMTMALLRTMFTALVHCISSACLGMAIGYARNRPGLFSKVAFVVLGYIVAVTNHAVWNGLATASGFDSVVETGMSPVVLLVGCALVFFASLLMFGLTQFSLKREHDFIRRHLAAEAQRGNLPTAHVDIIPYWLQRRRSGWLDADVDKDAYMRAATLLAFRQHQLEHAPDARRKQILEDVEAYRAEIRRLLGR